MFYYPYDESYNRIPPQRLLASAKTSQWEDVPILKKTIELYKTYYGYAQLFPKKDKYTIAALANGT